jgi:pSer/pThr/pTyr-binding forkhead associated (FHA) protein
VLNLSCAGAKCGVVSLSRGFLSGGEKMAMLIFKNGVKAGEIYRLGRGVITVGRAPHNPIQVLDRKASKVHFQVKRVGEGYEATDLKSTNGLFVNGQRVTSAGLTDWDEICVGDTILVYMASDVDLDHLPDGFPKHKIVSMRTRVEETVWEKPKKKPETLSDWKRDKS